MKNVLILFFRLKINREPGCGFLFNGRILRYPNLKYLINEPTRQHIPQFVALNRKQSLPTQLQQITNISKHVNNQRQRIKNIQNPFALLIPKHQTVPRIVQQSPIT